MKEPEKQRQPLKRADDGPRRQKPRVEVVRVKGGQHFDLTVISKGFYAYVIHWNAKYRRSRPCYEDPSVCQGCKDQLPQKRLYYLEAWSGTFGACFFEFTETAAFALTEILSAKVHWRGSRLRLSRSHANNGRLNVECKEWSEDPEKLPKETDPEEVLRKMWEAPNA
jgi:hypothetical protein